MVERSDRDILVEHQMWANRVVLIVLLCAVMLSIPMFLWLVGFPIYLRASLPTVGIGLWGILLLFVRIPSTRPYARFLASLMLNGFGLLLMVSLGGRNAAIPCFFFLMLAFSLIYLDLPVIWVTAAGSLLVHAVMIIAFPHIRDNPMFLNHTYRTYIYMGFIYALSVPTLHVAAKKARGLLFELQKRESVQRELNNALNKLLEQMAATSGVLQQSSQTLSEHAVELQASAEEAAAGMEEMSRMVEAQSDEISQVTMNVTQIGSIADETVRKAEELSVAFEQTLSASQRGVQLAQTTVANLERVCTNMEGLTGGARRLKESSVRIGEILELMEGLAKQASLLSLNANIEAARSGETTQGFAVVVDEIRHLADQAGEGSRQIAQLVSVVLQDIDAVFETVRADSSTVARGLGDIGKVRDDFAHIQQTIEQGTRRVGEVYMSMGELLSQNNAIMQSAGGLAGLAEETAAGTQAIAEAVQSQAHGIESVALQAHHLSGTARTLDNMTRKYRPTDDQ